MKYYGSLTFPFTDTTLSLFLLLFTDIQLKTVAYLMKFFFCLTLVERNKRFQIETTNRFSKNIHKILTELIMRLKIVN